MRVSRSLTIKQMAMVAAVAVVFIFIFLVIQLFHFVQQSRYNTATQMESIARSVRQPLSTAILKANIPEAEAILNAIQPTGIVARADVVLPNQFQALRVRFLPERPVPVMVARLFELPVQISLPLYSTERPGNPQPLAYLVLQADSWRMYKFILSTLSTLVTTYFLLALILTVAITWCINRLIVHPLRRIARELNHLDAQDAAGHQLALPRLHHDDEIGMLVRSYNRNQQMAMRQYDEMNTRTTRFPVTSLPNKALLMAMLEQSVIGNQTTAVIVVACETLQDAAGALNDAQRELLLRQLAEKMKAQLMPRMMLAQVSHYDFAILAHGVREPWQAMSLSQKLMAALNEPVALENSALRPTASIGIAMYYGDTSAEQLYRRAVSAALSARRAGKNQIQFFDEQQLTEAQQRLTEESDLLNALDNQAFAIWLQPQVALKTGEVVSAEVLLRQRQPDGEWALPDDLIERIESSGLMVHIGSWILEASCRLLAAWQRRGIMMPLSVNISALQLLHDDMVASVMELLHRYHIEPGTLILEVTESRRIDDPDAAVAILRPLRHAGVKVALDDFGMGYASLRQLHRMKSLPLDVIKIDKNFINDLPDDSCMVRAIINLAHSLQLSVIAEGVENTAQRQWLIDEGVEVAQGYLFARALPPAQFEADFLPASHQA
ncbi:biofilm formation regulator HmsP [Siccibacter colletis]|uniref:biofilm formation regulator HmsP n=1 Tax=Siccibacter colletis TaxID=1505757 RepID=UPI0028BEB2F5|nr:biofilm formation regulator HmsP [Siccibacter colletis]WNN48705.1 biofilm formation regulator HmsP [Siccibacter colletis]